MSKKDKSDMRSNNFSPRSGAEKILKEQMPVKQQRKKVKTDRVNMNHYPSPTEDEILEHAIIRNGVELSLSFESQDPNVVMAKDLHEKYPGYLVLIQAGDFLHAYNKCAHFLHRLKGYKIKLMGSGASAYLRVGFPLRNSKRRIWKVMSEFRVPYMLVLGTRSAGYKTYISERKFDTKSVLLEITDDIVNHIIEELRQTDMLNHAATTKLLLNKDVTFRLKAVAQELYSHLIRDIANYPRNHRHGLGRDMHESASELLRLVFDYALSLNREIVLRHLSSVVDRVKFLIAQAFELKLLNHDNINHRVALAVELGNLTGGLLGRLAKASQTTGASA